MKSNTRSSHCDLVAFEAFGLQLRFGLFDLMWRRSFYRQFVLMGGKSTRDADHQQVELAWTDKRQSASTSACSSELGMKAM
jgi:hypothetical protein